MYEDPRMIRSNPIRVRFNDPEKELIAALVRYTGSQEAVLVRELALEAARKRATEVSLDIPKAV